MMETNNKKDLNNKIIILRKHLKSTFNLTKLNLAKKIKKTKDPKQVARKESELECFKRIKFTDIPLPLGVHPDKLHKTLTNSSSSEIDRVTAKVLLNKQIQETISSLKENYGIEFVETFLISNEKNIKKNLTDKLNGVGKKSKKSEKKADSVQDSEEESDGNDGEDETDDDEGVEIEDGQSEEEPKPKKSKKSRDVKEKTSKTSKPAKAKSSKPVADKKSVDSFFVSAAGENYFASVAAASSSDSEGEIKAKFQKKQKKITKPFTKVRVKLPEVEELKVEPKKIRRPEVKPVAEADDIHPSWKAKAQMRKTQIQTFAGTKIKFDD